MISTLWNNTSYTIKNPLIIGDVYEYDIQSANINIMYNEGMITLPEYQECNRLDSMSRKIAVGNALRNSIYTDEHNETPILSYIDVEYFHSCFKKYIRAIIEANEIEDSEIISIKKDSIFVNRPLDITDFGNVHFINKGYYKLFILLGNLEIYYSDTTTFAIKGINDNKLYLHSPFITHIFSIIDIILNGDINVAIYKHLEFCKLYDSKTFDINYYRNLNGDSDYIINTMYSMYRVHNISEVDKGFVDISYNKNINRCLYAILTKVKIMTSYKPKKQ
jgi:hypothetical protein